MATDTITIQDLGEEAQKTLKGLSQQTVRWIELVVGGTKLNDAYRIAFSYRGENAGALVRKLKARAGVKLIMEEWQRVVAKRFDVTPEKVTAQYARLAFADIRDVFGEDGSMLAIKDWPRELADMVAGFDFEEMFAGQGEGRAQVGTVTKVRLITRKDALDSLARTLGMFIPEKKKTNETTKRVVMPAGMTKEEWAKMHAPGLMQ